MTPSLRTADPGHTAVTTTRRSWRVPRLRMKPKGPATGHVDGAWWPRSRDLPAEIAVLLVVVEVRLGTAERVSYHLTDWPRARRKLAVGDNMVRLEGFMAQHSDTVTVCGPWNRQRLTLLVVPPETDGVLAHRILMTAAHRDNSDTVETLLAAEIRATDARPVRGDK
ncbi:DUF5994 family protein [Amycolatopsis japonica]|uniref:DUF5994 family protein n=1 Tax=Amycolatopsis japonica TaxID=208439 RepID=UPI0033FBCA7C